MKTLLKIGDWSIIFVLVLILIAGVLLNNAYAAEPKELYGPYSAQYVKNTDGDTITLLIEIWPKTYILNNVRLLGVDTPEIRGAKCTREKALGNGAQVVVEVLLKQAKKITIYMTGLDSWGRALVLLKYDGKNLATTLLEQGAGVPMLTPTRTMDWCAGGKTPAA